MASARLWYVKMHSVRQLLSTSFLPGRRCIVPFSRCPVCAADIFVGGLRSTHDFDDDAHQLKRAFEKYGKVDDVVMKRGFAFLTMESEDQAIEAIRALDGEAMGESTRVTVKLNSKSMLPEVSSPTIHLNNLPRGAEESEVRQALSEIGKVFDLVLKDGFAFATFASVEVANTAIQSFKHGEVGPYRDVTVSMNKHFATKCLEVKNLSGELNTRQLREIFEAYGDVMSINVLEGEGRALVTMGTDAAAINARDGLHGNVVGDSTEVSIRFVRRETKPSTAIFGNKVYGDWGMSNRNSSVGVGYRNSDNIRCYKCGEVGHMARECLNGETSSGQSDNRSDDRRCFKCGEVGHLSRDCLNGETSSGQSDNRSDDRRCFKCGEVGHLSRDCPRSGRSDGVRCYKCGEVGHIARDCPTSQSSSRPSW
jgi:RNA recognition motif-containing protein